MISFFRRMLASKIGLAIAMVFLAVIALSFAATDVQNLGFGGGAGSSSSGPVARVDGNDVTQAELNSRFDQEWRTERQSQPTLDKIDFANAGGVDRTLDRLVNGLALEAFARAHGMEASRRLIDGRIASIPGFQGPSGQFDANIFRQVLQRERIGEGQLRADLARETLANQLMNPITGASQVPANLALPYANLLLERRSGAIAVIPATLVPEGPAPTAQELQALYQRRIAAFTVPERRSISFAVFNRDRVADAARPTEQEITQAYQADRARYAARETRDIGQIIVADRATADRVAQTVRGGTSVTAAAQAAGLQATQLNAVERQALAAASSAAVANAAFSAAQGSVAGPVRSPLGWHVLRIEGVEQIAARSLAQAREEIVTTLTATKTEAAMAEYVARIEDAAGTGSNMNDLARQFGLEVTTSAAITNDGVNPDRPTEEPPAVLGAVVTSAFESEQGEDPQVSALPGDAGYILWDLDSIVPATPRPLAQVRDQVAEQVIAERRARATRDIANRVAAAVTAGTPLPRALQQAGYGSVQVEQVAGTRAELTGGAQGQVSAPISLMLSMTPRTAKPLAAPNNAGHIVVYLDSAVQGDARRQPAVVQQTRGGIARVIGQEYGEQFVRAVRAAMNATVNTEAVAATRRQIIGQ